MRTVEERCSLAMFNIPVSRRVPAESRFSDLHSSEQLARPSHRFSLPLRHDMAAAAVSYSRLKCGNLRAPTFGDQIFRLPIHLSLEIGLCSPAKGRNIPMHQCCEEQNRRSALRQS